MKNKEGNCVAVGKLTSYEEKHGNAHYVLTIDLISETEESKDNFEALGDLGYADVACQCIKQKEPLEISNKVKLGKIEDYLQIILSDSDEKRKRAKTIKNKTMKASVKMYAEFFHITDGRKTTKKEN